MTEDFKFKSSIVSSAEGCAITANFIEPTGLSIYDAEGRPIFHMDGQGRLDYSITKTRQYIKDYADKTADFPKYQNNITYLVARAIVAVYDDASSYAPYNTLRHHLPGGGILAIRQNREDPLTYFKITAIDEETGKVRSVSATVVWDVLRGVENRRNYWSNFLIDRHEKYTTMKIACNEASDWLLDNQSFVESMISQNPALIKRR